MHGNLFFEKMSAYMRLLEPYTIILLSLYQYSKVWRTLICLIFVNFSKFLIEFISILKHLYNEKTYGMQLLFELLGCYLGRQTFSHCLHDYLSPTRLGNLGYLMVYTLIWAYTIIRTLRVASLPHNWWANISRPLD